MFEEVAVFISGYWVIFSFSFLVALTGAMSPGPMLTYTIAKSVKTPHRGYLMGVWIVFGHALIEMVIVLFLLLGFSFILKNQIVVRLIGIVGGFILCFFGFAIIRDAKRGKIESDFLETSHPETAETTISPVNPDSKRQITRQKQSKGIWTALMANPVLGGMIVSMSNPYWWVWWATIGFAFMVQFEVSLYQWPKLLAFFVGHEAGDLVWYLFVSFFSFFGIRYLSKKAYHGILIFCGIFMIVFGLYLGVMPFFKVI